MKDFTLPGWSRSNRLFLLLSFLLLEAVALAVYWPATRGFFQAEDFLWLRLATPQSVWQSFSGTWGHGIAYRPLVRVSYYVDWLVFGRRPFGWHLVNILLIGIDAALLATVLLRLRAGRMFALVTALLFLTGPFGRENIDWISGRTGLLGFLFMLCGVLAWLRGSVPGCVTLTALGLATYEPLVVLPAILLLLTPIAAANTERDRRELLRNVMVVAATTVAFWFLRYLLLKRAGASLDKLHRDPVTAIRMNSVQLAGLFAWCWSLRALIMLGAAGLLCFLYRKTRFTALFLIGSAAVLYAPYAMVVGVPLRFVFMSQAPLLALMVLPVVLLRPGLSRTLVCAGILLTMLPTFIARSRANAVEAAAAGQMARTILERAGGIATTDTTSNLVFACVPDAWSGWVLLAGDFGIAVDDWFGLSQGRVWNREDAVRDENVLRRLRNTPTRLFKYTQGGFVELAKPIELAAPIQCD